MPTTDPASSDRPDDDEVDRTEGAGDGDGAGRVSGVSRRMMLRGATLGGLSLPLLAACGSGGDAAGSDPSGAASGSASGSAEASPGGSGSSEGSSGAGGGAGATVAAAEVPVGGGAILPDEKLVVTQPTKGDFAAFSAICTHQGCPVSAVKNGQIVCPCHGSTFSITDGAPTAGPATKALADRKVTVSGSNLTIT